jgi:hypothetical protein
LNWDIVDAMSTVKELVLSPDGIAAEPLGVVPPDVGELDDEQPVAARVTTTPATATQSSRE